MLGLHTISGFLCLFCFLNPAIYMTEGVFLFIHKHVTLIFIYYFCLIFILPYYNLNNLVANLVIYTSSFCFTFCSLLFQCEISFLNLFSSTTNFHVFVLYDIKFCLYQLSVEVCAPKLTALGLL